MESSSDHELLGENLPLVACQQGGHAHKRRETYGEDERRGREIEMRKRTMGAELITQITHVGVICHCSCNSLPKNMPQFFM